MRCATPMTRHAQRKKREKREIGLHSVRGGTIVGEHQVIFAGQSEVLTLSHSAQSKEALRLRGGQRRPVHERQRPLGSTTCPI